MANQLTERTNSKLKILFISGFIFAFICASVYLFLTALDDNAKINHSEINPQIRTEKFH